MSAEEQNSELEILVRGAEAIFKNAVALYEEASLLKKAGAVNRALFLHQISLEELSKLEILGGTVAYLFMGNKLNHKELQDEFRSHQTKNNANSYFLPVSDEEKSAREKKDLSGAVAAFKKRQIDFHEKSNFEKNASLYVDFHEGAFRAPSDAITEEMVKAISVRNELFLGLFKPKLDMLKRWLSKPNETADLVKDFVTRVRALQEKKPEDPISALNEMLDGWMSEQIKKVQTV